MATEDTAQRTRDAAEDTALLEQAKREGRAFVASTRFTVAAGASANMHLKNPSGSGRDANVQAMIARTQFEATVDVWDTFVTAPSGGTTNGIDNLIMDTEGGDDSGVMEIATGVTFDGDNTHVRGVIPSGGPGGKIGGVSDTTPPLIEPEREIVAEVNNTSGSENAAAITIVYVEEANE